MNSLTEFLKTKEYPGRGIALGRSQDGKYGVIVYFIMGRSVNSRNRIFVDTADGIRTEAFDPDKMEDPSLIIYHPVRTVMDEEADKPVTIVTNGNQTDTIRDFMLEDKGYIEALNTREFEPDGPNFTPRISGILYPNGTYMLSILKSLYGDPDCCVRNYFTYDAPKAGTCHFISTYQDNGNPLPSFEGEPVMLSISGSLDDFTEEVWNALNEENKISLFIRYVDLESGHSDTRIINKNM